MLTSNWSRNLSIITPVYPLNDGVKIGSCIETKVLKISFYVNCSWTRHSILLPPVVPWLVVSFSFFIKSKCDERFLVKRILKISSSWIISFKDQYVEGSLTVMKHDRQLILVLLYPTKCPKINIIEQLLHWFIHGKIHLHSQDMIFLHMLP